MMQTIQTNQLPSSLVPHLQTYQDKILQAIFQVKKKLQGVTKGTNNPFFKSKYADLNAYLDTVEPLLEEYGMMLLQPVTTMYSQAGIENVVTSRIYHVESGQSIESSMKLVGGSDMQKMGSGVTYARRYTLGSLLSMQALDDDGETIIDRGGKDKDPRKATPVAAKPAAVPVQEQKTSGLPKSTLVPAKEQTVAAAPKEETKPARPSFRRPAKPAVTETAPTAAAPAEDAGHGDDI